MNQKIRLFLTKYWLKISFFVLGIASLIWFLIRVIPKPSRAQHPCMKVAAPLASSFISYLLGITAFTLILKKTKEHIQKSRFLLASILVLVGLITGTWIILHTNSTINATDLQPAQTGNQPIGVAKGTIPGRVLWVHNPDATNEDCTNEGDDLWYKSTNTNQTVVSTMVYDGLRKMTGASTNVAAWDSIFYYYNRTHGRGNVGYTAGEKIVIKINLNAGDANPHINTSPQVCYTILDQLINVAHVAQADIGIGDPISYVGDATWSICHSVFPNVKYWGSGSGRTSIVQSTQPVLKLSNGESDLYIPQQYVDATYMINIPVFKKHHRAGISLVCKNHFGSIGAFASPFNVAHQYLPCPEASGDAVNGDYGSYRIFVDFMGHKDLGGKTILYLVDGLWSSVNWGHPPIKWEMTPFNNDWPSSLFLSQDPVALESVCFDFLYNEFDEDHPTEGIETMSDDKGPFPHFAGTDDHLHQSADPANWPAGITYDPEGDGTAMTSVGTHEHWNNPVDKQYSRNLGTGNGIELVYMYGSTAINEHMDDLLNECTNYPNPFIGSTTINYKISKPSEVFLTIYNSTGQVVKSEKINHKSAGDYNYTWNTFGTDGASVSAGTYICSIELKDQNGETSKISTKMLLIR